MTALVVASAVTAGTKGAQGEADFAKIAALMQAKQPLKSVIGLLGTPAAAFVPDKESETRGFAGNPGEVAFRYEIIVPIGSPRNMDLWVVFSAAGGAIKRMVLSSPPDEKNLPSKEQIANLVGHPQRVVHTRWLGSPDDMELAMGTCNDPSGNIEVWLYDRGLEVTFPVSGEAGGTLEVLFLSPDAIKNEYPDCKK